MRLLPVFVVVALLVAACSPGGGRVALPSTPAVEPSPPVGESAVEDSPADNEGVKASDSSENDELGRLLSDDLDDALSDLGTFE